MIAASRAGLIAVAAGLVAGCVSHPPQMVVLVPDKSGKVGTVVVSGAGGTTTLNQAFSAARVETTGGKSEIQTVTPSEVKAVFAGAMAAQPRRPVSFLLYFREGTDEYTPASKLEIKKVFTEVARRKTAEIDVIGHTDRVGTVEYNDALSLKRAQRVRKDFAARGMGNPPRAISVAGRGEREPLVPTADEVSEPRNRRVEINVR